MRRVLCISEAEFDDWEEGRVRPPGLNVLEIARLLAVEPDSFFEGLDEGGTTASSIEIPVAP
jgi:hypothetical protein